MIKEVNESLEDERTVGFLEESVNEFEVCCRRAIESVLSAPTMNAGRFGLSPSLNSLCRTTSNIQSGNEEYSVTITFGVEPADLAALVPGDADLAMQLDAIGEITNIIAGSFLTHRRFSERFGIIAPALPFFVNGGGAEQNSWCIQGQLRVNSIKVYLGVAVGKAVREGLFPCKNPL